MITSTQHAANPVSTTPSKHELHLHTDMGSKLGSKLDSNDSSAIPSSSWVDSNDQVQDGMPAMGLVVSKSYEVLCNRLGEKGEINWRLNFTFTNSIDIFIWQYEAPCSEVFSRSSLVSPMYSCQVVDSTGKYILDWLMIQSKYIELPVDQKDISVELRII